MKVSIGAIFVLLVSSVSGSSENVASMDDKFIDVESYSGFPFLFKFILKNFKGVCYIIVRGILRAVPSAGHLGHVPQVQHDQGALKWGFEAKKS